MFDIVGIGFGPSNIALAVAMDEGRAPLSALFLEQSPSATWHHGMLLEGSDTQHSFLRDFITPVNPRSKYSFANYLHETGRFFEFLNLGRVFALRRDVSNYVQWVAGHFSNVQFGAGVASLEMVESAGARVWEVVCADGQRHLARTVVMGVGRALNIPRGLEEDDRVIHLSRYLDRIGQLDGTRTVAVLGASQSAVELLLDLRERGFRRVHSIHRSFSYRLKDTSPFSDEVYFPEFVDYYHALPADKRAMLDTQVRQTNYSCADRDVIERLYERLYEDRLSGHERVVVHRNQEIVECVRGPRLAIRLREVYTAAERGLDVDLLVLATGYLDVGRDGRGAMPSLLRSYTDLFHWEGPYLSVGRDYRVEYQPAHVDCPDVYFNGLCESSHGMGDAGSFSLVSLRARDILRSTLQRNHRHADRIYDVRNPESTVSPPDSSGV